MDEETGEVVPVRGPLPLPREAQDVIDAARDVADGGDRKRLAQALADYDAWAATRALAAHIAVEWTVGEWSNVVDGEPCDYMRARLWSTTPEIEAAHVYQYAPDWAQNGRWGWRVYDPRGDMVRRWTNPTGKAHNSVTVACSTEQEARDAADAVLAELYGPGVAR